MFQPRELSTFRVSRTIFCAIFPMHGQIKSIYRIPVCSVRAIHTHLTPTIAPMVGDSGNMFDIYLLHSDEPGDPSVYLIFPAGSEVSILDLLRDHSSILMLGVYPDSTGRGNHGVCTIFLEDTRDECDFKTTFCNHTFHTQCIFRALRYRMHCPNCNEGLLYLW